MAGTRAATRDTGIDAGKCWPAGWLTDDTARARDRGRGAADAAAGPGEQQRGRGRPRAAAADARDAVRAVLAGQPHGATAHVPGPRGRARRALPAARARARRIRGGAVPRCGRPARSACRTGARSARSRRCSAQVRAPGGALSERAPCPCGPIAWGPCAGLRTASAACDVAGTRHCVCAWIAVECKRHKPPCKQRHDSVAQCALAQSG